MTLPFASNPSREAPQWLQEKVYATKIDRTIKLVKASVDTLHQANKPISLTTIAAKSKELDPEGQGVSVSAINRNQEANEYYKQHRSHKESSGRQRQAKELSADTLRIKPERDLGRVQQRYLKFTKQELVARLLVVEKAFAEQQELWHQSNDTQLAQYLKVEQEELQDLQLDSGEEESQDLTVKLQRLRAKNRELKAQLAGMDSLVRESEELRKENQRLFNRITQLEATERQMNSKRFVEALREAERQPEVPEVEF